MKDDVLFRDIRALAATDAARRGENRSDILKRLVHTSGKTTDICIQEVIAAVSEILMALPWLEKSPTFANSRHPLSTPDGCFRPKADTPVKQILQPNQHSLCEELY